MKPKIKQNTQGMGYKKSELNWWEGVMNKRLQNLNVIKKDDDTFNFVVTPEPSEKSQPFLKSATLQNGFLLEEPKAVIEEDKPSNFPIVQLTDEELFQACGGRTAHKGARHGIAKGGKLARIEQQEKSVLNLGNVKKEELFKRIIQTETQNLSRKNADELEIKQLKKIEKKETKRKREEELAEATKGETQDSVELCTVTKPKKKKKKVQELVEEICTETRHKKKSKDKKCKKGEEEES